MNCTVREYGDYAWAWDCRLRLIKCRKTGCKIESGYRTLTHEERQDGQRIGSGTVCEQACMNKDMEAAYASRSRRCLKRTVLLAKGKHV